MCIFKKFLHELYIPPSKVCFIFVLMEPSPKSVKILLVEAQMSNYKREWRQGERAGEYYFRVVGASGGWENTVLGVENTISQCWVTP